MQKKNVSEPNEKEEEEKVKPPPPFRLNEKEGRDVEILAYLYQYRRLTIDHLIMLTGRSRTRLVRRLGGLARGEYIYQQRKDDYTKYVYTICQRGVPVLVKHGILEEDALDERITSISPE